MGRSEKEELCHGIPQTEKKKKRQQNSYFCFIQRGLFICSRTLNCPVKPRAEQILWLSRATHCQELPQADQDVLSTSILGGFILRALEHHAVWASTLDLSATTPQCRRKRKKTKEENHPKKHRVGCLLMASHGVDCSRIKSPDSKHPSALMLSG